MTNFKQILTLLLLVATSCSEFVEVNAPENQITSETVFQDDETAKSAMNGLYIEMSKSPVFRNAAIAVLTGLSADELLTTEPDYLQYQENELSADNPHLLADIWKPAYRFIYQANSILQGLQYSSSVVSFEIRQQLEGEARFIRAFSYFYLTNIFGQVPLAISTRFEYNDAIKRSDVQDVYDLIKTDLEIARELLPEGFPMILNREQRIRITSWAALALQAKVHLYQKEWRETESAATLVIDNSSLFELANNIEDVFAQDSKEAIWQLQPVIPGLGTWEANMFVPAMGVPNFLLTSGMLIEFQQGDKRRESWVDSVDNGTAEPYFYPAKYKHPYSNDEYHIELRLAEVFLIRAEARANLGNLLGGIEDLDAVRERAGLAATVPDISMDELHKAIQRERRIELFTEGNRLFDLKRWGITGSVLGKLDYKKWRDTDVLYPVPESQLQQNTNLLPQNEGY